MAATLQSPTLHLDERRKELRMTIPQLAKRSGVSTATAARVLRGDPTVAVGRVCAVADALGMETIVLHPFAGVLSAYGMGLAEVRALRERQIEGAFDEAVRAQAGAALEPIEKASIDELRSLQLERLKWSLAHAYENVAFYKKSFDAAGIHPSDLNSLEDLARFPFTVKNDLRDNYPFGMFAVPREQVVRVHASSGTTGKPTVVGYTQNDIDTWSHVMARSIRAAGGKPGDLCHVAYGYGLFTGGLGAHYGAERLGCTVIPMGGGQTEKQVQLINDFKPRIIMVTPSYCLNIADEMERQGIDAVNCSLEIAIFGAEPWTNEMRASIEQRLGLDAVDIYGLSEVMGPGVAQECVETKDGPTIWEDIFYPEVINPETGEVCENGEQGELVFTTLTKEGLPMIRYRTRDLTRLLPGTARSMRRMSWAVVHRTAIVANREGSVVLEVRARSNTSRTANAT